MPGNAVSLGLRVDEKHAQLPGIQAREVDHPRTTLLAHSGPRPADLPATATPSNDSAGLWLCCDPREELKPLVFGPDLGRLSHEGWCFKDGEHAIVYGKDVLPVQWFAAATLAGLTFYMSGGLKGAKRPLARPLDEAVCAQHGRELMGCKSHVGVPTWTRHESKDNHEPKARAKPQGLVRRKPECKRCEGEPGQEQS